jgi:hypothetical protein
MLFVWGSTCHDKGVDVWERTGPPWMLWLSSSNWLMLVERSTIPGQEATESMSKALLGTKAPKLGLRGGFGQLTGENYMTIDNLVEVSVSLFMENSLRNQVGPY